MNCPQIFDFYSQQTGTCMQAPVFVFDQYCEDSFIAVFPVFYGLLRGTGIPSGAADAVVRLPCDAELITSPVSCPEGSAPLPSGAVFSGPLLSGPPAPG
jgi:hypothetical protein